jgi:hypothetical protein
VALVFLAGAQLGVFPAYGGYHHYWEHAYPALAVVTAVPLAVLGYGLVARLGARLAAPPFLGQLKPWTVPLALSLVVAWNPPSPAAPNLHRANVEGLRDLLHDDWKWDWAAVTRELRVSYKAILVDYLSTMVPGWEKEGRIEPSRPHQPLVVIEVERRRVPDPLPAGWVAISRAVRFTLLAIPTGSSLDWGSLTTCFTNPQGDEQCHDSSNHHNLLRFMDKSLATAIRSVTRRVPWQGTPGVTEKILLPRQHLLCAGQIDSGPPGTRIVEDGQIAYVSQPGEVVLKWTPGSRGCERWHYGKEDDPFVVAGDPATVDLIRELIDEGRP